MGHRLIVSSCGTSAITFGVSDPDLRKLLLGTANVRQEEVLNGGNESILVLREHVETQLARLKSSDAATAQRRSAELNGLLALCHGEVSAKKRGLPDRHFLLHSDTYQGQCAAEAVAAWLTEHGALAFTVCVRDMNTASLSSYRASMVYLIEWCEQTLNGYKDQGYRIVFNLVGGFKSLQGYMQILGMFYADESVYLFEGSGELLRIPRLPIKIDVTEPFAEHLSIVRRLAVGFAVPVVECEGLPETLLFQLDGEAVLSDWGQLMWNQVKGALLDTELLPPLSKKLQYTNRCQRDFASLPRDRRIVINERLDQLARCLDENLAYNPKSLNLKPLKGKPAPPCTHEFRGWMEGKAWRGFGHFDGGVFVVDGLDEHL